MDPSAIFSSFDSVTTVIGAIFAGIVTIIVLICWWRIFHKAGKAGILAIIPFVNLWTYFKISTRNYLLWFILAIIPATTVIASIAGCFGLAKAFGKGPLFGLFLFFFPYLALPVLAFGRARYVGIRGEGSYRR